MIYNTFYLIVVCSDNPVFILWVFMYKCMLHPESRHLWVDTFLLPVWSSWHITAKEKQKLRPLAIWKYFPDSVNGAVIVPEVNLHTSFLWCVNVKLPRSCFTYYKKAWWLKLIYRIQKYRKKIPHTGDIKYFGRYG